MAHSETASIRTLKVCGLVLAVSAAVTAISSCGGPMLYGERPALVARQTPVPGTVVARWPQTLQVDSTGVVVVDIQALSDFPTDLGPEGTEGPDSASAKWRTVPVYVAPGDVRLTLEALDGLSVVSPRDVDVSVQRGKVSEASWSVKATTPGESGVRITATRLARANPEEPMTPAELAMLDLDDMQLNLTLDIEGLPAAPAALKTAPTTSDLSVLEILGIAVILLGTLQFVLWLIAEQLDKRGRAPRMAAIIGWLPRTIGQFRNRGTTADSSSETRSD